MVMHELDTKPRLYVKYMVPGTSEVTDLWYRFLISQAMWRVRLVLGCEPCMQSPCSVWVVDREHYYYRDGRPEHTTSSVFYVFSETQVYGME